MTFGHDKRSENKAQWHFSKSKTPKDYEPNDENIHSDVLGSYSGTPYETGDDEPVQDADDL